jgi:CheY-like chemotaxis protein
MTTTARKSVLVVEDDNQVLASLERRLRSAGFDVVTASTGQEAVDFARQYLPAAITLDIRLPDFDGLEVAQQLRDDLLTHGIPIIFLTGRVDRALQEDYQAVGGRFYIRKPYDPQLLVCALTELITPRQPKRLPAESQEQ